MKIGLLTTYSFNYGSYFQAIALQKKLQEMGHECELINEEIKKYKWLNLFLMYTMDPLLPRRIKKVVAKKIPQYNSYLKIRTEAAQVPHSPRHIHNFSRLSSRYDCIVIGSDELWSADRHSIRFVPEYFGYGCKCPIFSYATCAVRLDMTNETLLRKVQKGLAHFEAISVRDNTSQEKIERLLPDKKIEKVLDPTLLNPFFPFRNAKSNSRKYVLLYGQHYNKAQIAFIKNYAKTNGYEIRCVGWRQEWCDTFIDTCSGEALQQAFAEAEFCFPSTFHGTVFSIVNHRQFISMLNPLRGEKVELLLEELDLQDRIYREGMDAADLEKIDYKIVDTLLAARREASSKYITQVLEGIMKKCR